MAFRETVVPLLEAFRPDALVTQIGIDSHYRDPITHLALTVQGFAEAVGAFAGVAPLWLTLGGGGYDLQAVARAWTLAFGVLSEQHLPEDVRAPYRDTYGVSVLRDAEEPPSGSRRGTTRADSPSAACSRSSAPSSDASTRIGPTAVPDRRDR